MKEVIAIPIVQMGKQTYNGYVTHPNGLVMVLGFKFRVKC